MPRGGFRPGAGRRTGTKNVKSRKIAEQAAAQGITPLEFMLNVMRGTACPDDAAPEVKVRMAELQFEAAKASAPYVHPRLNAVAHTGVPAPVEIEDMDADELSYSLARRIAYALDYKPNNKEKKKNGGE